MIFGWTYHGGFSFWLAFGLPTQKGLSKETMQFEEENMTKPTSTPLEVHVTDGLGPQTIELSGTSMCKIKVICCRSTIQLRESCSIKGTSIHDGDVRGSRPPGNLSHQDLIQARS